MAGAVRRHLGQVLACAYAGLPDHKPPDHLSELLTKLESALASQASTDARAFCEALIGFAPNLLRYATSLARHRSQAEDLVQETLLKAWKNQARLRAGSNLDAWLFTILRNTYFTEYCKRKRELLQGDGSYAEGLAAVPSQDGALALQDVKLALSKLPDPMRQALILVAVNDMSYEEAATVMGCEVGTIKSRTSRARKKLADHLGYAGQEIGADQLLLSALEWSERGGRPDGAET